MKGFTVAILTLFLFATNLIKAQDQSLAFTQQEIADHDHQDSWTIGLGSNIVENNGAKFRRIFNDWNMVPFPSMLTVDRELPAGFTAEAAFTYNQFEKGRDIQGVNNPQVENYFALDVIVKYDFHCLFNNTSWPVQPYIFWGYGLTYMGMPLMNTEEQINIKYDYFGTNDAGLGFNVPFKNIFKKAPDNSSIKYITLGFQAAGKWADLQAGHNVVQYTFEIRYDISHLKRGGANSVNIPPM